MGKEIEVCPYYEVYITQLRKEMYMGRNAKGTQTHREQGCDECRGIMNPRCQVRKDLSEILE